MEAETLPTTPVAVATPPTPTGLALSRSARLGSRAPLTAAHTRHRQLYATRAPFRCRDRELIVALLATDSSPWLITGVTAATRTQASNDDGNEPCVFFHHREGLGKAVFGCAR